MPSPRLPPGGAGMFFYESSSIDGGHSTEALQGAKAPKQPEQELRYRRG